MSVGPVIQGSDHPKGLWASTLVKPCEVTMKDGKVRSDDPVYYEFVSLSWNKTADAVVKFHHSYEAMPPELRMFCLLKAQQ